MLQLAFVLLLKLPYILSTSKDIKDTIQRINKKYSFLATELDLDKKSKLAFTDHAVYIFRRVIFALTVIYMMEYPS